VYYPTWREVLRATYRRTTLPTLHGLGTAPFDALSRRRARCMESRTAACARSVAGCTSTAKRFVSVSSSAHVGWVTKRDAGKEGWDSTRARLRFATSDTVRLVNALVNRPPGAGRARRGTATRAESTVSATPRLASQSPCRAQIAHPLVPVREFRGNLEGAVRRAKEPRQCRQPPRNRRLTRTPRGRVSFQAGTRNCRSLTRDFELEPEHTAAQGHRRGVACSVRKPGQAPREGHDVVRPRRFLDETGAVRPVNRGGWAGPARRRTPLGDATLGCRVRGYANATYTAQIS